MARAAGQGAADRASAPPQKAVVVAPHDTNDLAAETSGVWVGGAGTLTVIMAGDTASTLLSGIPAGTYLPIAAKRILATGTTATLIVAFSA